MGTPSAREAACFERLKALRRLAIQKGIDDLDAGRSHAFEYSLGGFRGLEPQATLGGRLKQIALLPVALAIILPMLLMTPIAYVAHLRKRRHARRALDAQLRALGVEAVELPASMPKTLQVLWFEWEIERYGLSSDDEFQLIGDWVGILYGAQTKDALHIQQRTDAIRSRRSSAYNVSAAKGILVSFMSIGQELVGELSNALPPYQEHDFDMAPAGKAPATDGSGASGAQAGAAGLAAGKPASTLTSASEEDLPYTVYVDDNFDAPGDAHHSLLGRYATLEEAIAVCKRIVDESLAVHITPGISASQLYADYTTFGDDPWIQSPGRASDPVPFSAREYAKVRAAKMCAGGAVE